MRILHFISCTNYGQTRHIPDLVRTNQGRTTSRRVTAEEIPQQVQEVSASVLRINAESDSNNQEKILKNRMLGTYSVAVLARGKLTALYSSAQSVRTLLENLDLT